MRIFATLFLTTMLPQLALAAGYEKPVLFSARQASLGGVGSLAGNSAEGLAFNPGLIANGKKGWITSVNISPTTSQLSGPWNNENELVTSNRGTSLSGAGMFSYNFNEKWAVAFGGYAIGGGNTTYDQVIFKDFGDQKLDFYSNIKMLELAAGVGYRLNDMWVFGITGRRLTYTASYIRPARAALGFAIGAPEFKDLESNSFGYKLGLTFKPNVRWRLGAVYRSPIDIDAKGQVAGGKTIVSPIPLNPDIEPGEARMMTVLPSSYALSAAYRWTNLWQSFVEYHVTNYSAVKNVEIETTSSTVGNKTSVQNWKDQTIYKIGLEYTRFRMPVRLGFNQTSMVTDPDYSNPMQYPAAVMNSYTIGTGIRWKIFGNVAQFDIAVDKTNAQGEGGTGRAGTDWLTDSRQGTYGIDILATHASFNYYFGEDNKAKSQPVPSAPTEGAPAPVPTTEGPEA